MTRRTDRVNDLLREEISDLIRRELKDPRLAGLVSITEVDVSPDLRHAKVLYSVLGTSEDKASTAKALSAAAAFLRHELRNRLTLRRTPELAFQADTSLERGAEILALLSETAADEEPAP